VNTLSETDAALIRAARATQTAAIARGDYVTAILFWTEDITVRRALGQAVSGIEDALAAIVPGGDSPLVYQRETMSVEVSSHWPLAFEEGYWSGHPGSAEAPPVMDGRYAAQWVKRNGRWLIRSEVFVALNCENGGCAATALP